MDKRVKRDREVVSREREVVSIESERKRERERETAKERVSIESLKALREVVEGGL